MVKRFVMICLSFILAPFSALAISFTDIQDNMAKYALVYDSPDGSAAVDIDSIRILRDEFPYVTVEAEFYIITNKQNMIIKDTRNFSFDVSQSAAFLIPEIEKKHPEYTQKEKEDALTLMQTENPGIIMSFPRWEIFGIKGKPYPDINKAIAHVINTTEERKVKYGEIPWEVANYIFGKYADSKYGLFGLPGPHGGPYF